MTHREFTIERQLRLTHGDAKASLPPEAEEASQTGTSDSELVAEVRALRADIASMSERFAEQETSPGSANAADTDDAADSADPQDASDIESIREENEFLRREIARMVRSMAQAKEQIAAIKHPEVTDDQVNDASNELHAIVSTTENATTTILEMGEGIQELAERLNTIMGQDDDVQATCGDIITKVNSMFEACNFQDITGQRVTKVVSTLQFIEERLRTIINVWGTEAFAEIPIPSRQQLHETDDLVNGPAALDCGLGQDEIDALFG